MYGLYAYIHVHAFVNTDIQAYTFIYRPTLYINAHMAKYMYTFTKIFVISIIYIHRYTYIIYMHTYICMYVCMYVYVCICMYEHLL